MVQPLRILVASAALLLGALFPVVAADSRHPAEPCGWQEGPCFVGTCVGGPGFCHPFYPVCIGDESTWPVCATHGYVTCVRLLGALTVCVLETEGDPPLPRLTVRTDVLV